MAKKRKSTNEPYFVEVIDNGCSKCGCHRQWAVVGPDGAASGQSWGEEEDAAYVAELLNDAYYVGASEFEKRLRKIEDIIDRAENICLAVDGPVTSTLQAITSDDMKDIYALASGKTRRK